MNTQSNISRVWGILLLASLVSVTSGEARERKQLRTGEGSIASREPSEAGASGSRDFNWGLGFSTIDNTLSGTGSITATFDLDQSNTLQALISMPSTSPFNLGLGLLFKHTIVQGQSSGFHLGGGFGFADINSRGATTYLMSIGFIAGFHFEVPGLSRVMVHLDGGPTLYMQTSGNASSTSFVITPLTPALGLSVVYQL